MLDLAPWTMIISVSGVISNQIQVAPMLFMFKKFGAYGVIDFNCSPFVLVLGLQLSFSLVNL